MRRFIVSMIAVVVWTYTSWTLADDWFAIVRLHDLAITAGDPPASANDMEKARASQFAGRPPRVAVDGEAEAYLESSTAATERPLLLSLPDASVRLAVRTPTRRDITGVLIWPLLEGKTRHIEFRIAAEQLSLERRREFHELRLNHYNELCRRGLPGGAWFRHQSVLSSRALGMTDYVPPSPNRIGGGDVAVDPTLEMLSGERALHENLQLDRQLASTTPVPPTIDIQSISGIRAKEIDWQPLIRDKQPTFDPLAKYIPSDQHVVFFPSAAAVLQVIQAIERPATPLLRATEGTSTNHHVIARYEQQLGVSLNQFALADSPLARQLTPGIIKTVAITGGDPYFRTGTDLAVLIESQSPRALRTIVLAEIARQHPDSPSIRTVEHELAGSRCWSRVAEDHSVRSFVLELPNCVVVSNSLAQIRGIAETAVEQRESLAKLPEYLFFRDRYRIQDANESALVMVSDPTIRRWCGPRWRISHSRRTRAAAVLADRQCELVDSLVKGTLQPAPLIGPQPAATGRLSQVACGVHSHDYGNLRFLTPITELDLTQVTEEERTRYIAWRDQYERYWQQAFDPIAVRLNVSERQIEFDLTIMPLIDNSNYRWLSTISQGATLGVRSGDPHDGVLVHFVHAINLKEANGIRNVIRGICTDSQGRGDPAKWLGDSIALYVEDDAIWRKYAHYSEIELLTASLTQDVQLPVALRFEVKDQTELGFAMAQLKLVLDQLGGKPSTWSEREYKGYRYSYRSVDKKNSSHSGFAMSLYSLAADDQWLITFNESLLHRSIDRLIAAKKTQGKPDAPDGKKPDAQADRTWLGDHAALELKGPFSTSFQEMVSLGFDSRMRQIVHDTLPILNEWKRLYPDRDPVETHERLWGVKLECPAGGEYRWNAEQRTMESSVLGTSYEPRNKPLKSPLITDLQRLGLGLTFENNGLRAKGAWTAK
ncbi:MAG: hypothetical protein U1A77_25995 [Pirellulales bacterium]